MVYRARDIKLDRDVALKFLPPHLTQSEEDKQRFIREAKAAAALNHPNICTIHNVDEHEGNQFIVMEYIDGNTLGELQKSGKLKPKMVIEYAIQVAEALSKAHDAGIIHRDIKPGNIMVNADGHIKVMDFGLAKLKGSAGEITKTGSTVGTMAYMAPEQIQGREVDHRADIFAFGVVLFEMLAGIRPFRGEHEAALTYSIVNEEPVSIRNHLPGAPEELERFFEKALAKEPKERFSDTNEMKSILKALLDAEIAGTEESNTVVASADSGTEEESTSSSSSTTISITLPGIDLGGRSLLIGIAGIVLVALFMGWWFLDTGPVEDEVAIDSSRVAVFPFEVRGAEELDYLGEGMVELMGRSLDGAGALEAVDWSALLVQLREGAYVSVGPDQAAEIAAGFGAGSFLLGSILRVGEQIHLGARWYGADGEQIGRHEVLAEGEDEIQKAIDALSRVVISELTGGEADPRGRLAAETTSSVDALRAYLEGQAALRAYDWSGAQEALERAVDADPDFALAHLGLSWTAAWQAEPEASRSAAERAVALSEDLPSRDRDLIEAQYAYTEGRADDAVRLYRRLVEAHPDDVDAWYWLGETLFHFNQIRGRSVVEARGPLERALELDPGNSEPLLHLVEIAALERDREAVDSLSAEGVRRDLAPEWQAAFRDFRFFVFDDARRPDPEELTLARAHTASAILYGLGRLEEAEEPWRLAAAGAREPVTEAYARARVAGLRAAQGKLAGAREEFEVVAGLATATHLIYRAKLAMLPWRPENERKDEERDDLVERLEAWDATVPEWVVPLVLTPPVDRLPAFRLYLLGLLRAEAGDLSAVEDFAEELRDMEPIELFPTFRSDLSRALLAEAALQQEDPEGALEHLEAVELRGEPVHLHYLYSGARERFLRAELLAEAERFEEALGWYESVPSLYDVDAVPYVAPAHLGRGRVLEDLDRPNEAAQAYERFLNLWQNADPVFRPKVEEVQEHLKQLTAEE